VSRLLAAATVPTDVFPAGSRLEFETSEYDRNPGLHPQETQALAELDPHQLRRNRARGIPRRTAKQWTSLARLVEPLDAALAAARRAPRCSPPRCKLSGRSCEIDDPQRTADGFVATNGATRYAVSSTALIITQGTAAPGTSGLSHTPTSQDA